jgi:hypothetical protein
MILLYIWALLSTPTDRMICSMWISNPPTRADMAAAGCIWSAELAPVYVWRAIDWRTGQVFCERPAAELPILTCDLWPLDSYLLRVYEPDYQDQLCWVTLRHAGPPEPGEMDQCDKNSVATLQNGQATWKLMTSGPQGTPEPPAAACTLPQVDNSSPLATYNDYQFLEGRLKWWGVNISSADWQNRFDEQIGGGADAAGVPAALLKAMIAQESQFWPLWTGSDGEVGWMQLTWDGADNVLRQDLDLFKRYCPRAIWGNYCTSYDLLTMDQRRLVQAELVNSLQVAGTPIEAAAMAASDLWIDAHILRAYACQAQALYPDRDVWQTAAVIYNAGPGCIRANVVCKAGQDYLNEISSKPAIYSDTRSNYQLTSTSSTMAAANLALFDDIAPSPFLMGRDPISPFLMM